MLKQRLEWIVFFGIVFFDQLIKISVMMTMRQGESILVIPQVFHITYILNPGAAFGLFEYQRGLFIAIALIFLLAAAYYYPQWRLEGAKIRYGVVLLLGGAIGNLIDRIQSGFVVDYLDFRIWPIFNLADIAIVFGVASLIYAIFFESGDQ